MYYSFSEQCEELRSVQSKRNQDEVCRERNEQILLKEEERKQQEEIEKMFANLWERDRLLKSEREEQDAKDQIGRNRESLKVSAHDNTMFNSNMFLNTVLIPTLTHAYMYE